jgi:hypothetical protein
MATGPVECASTLALRLIPYGPNQCRGTWDERCRPIRKRRQRLGSVELPTCRTRLSIATSNMCGHGQQLYVCKSSRAAHEDQAIR